MTKQNKIALLLATLGGVLTILIYQLSKTVKDGWGANGFDDEGGLGKIASPPAFGDTTTYADSPIEMKYFKIGDFDSKGAGEAGTGVRMKISTLKMLDAARGKAGVPFIINSGYRTEKHNAAVGGVEDSAHIKGYAVDIQTNNGLTDQKRKAKALYEAGFRRFGIYKTFIHVDNDPSKPSPALWTGQGLSNPPFNPADLITA